LAGIKVNSPTLFCREQFLDKKLLLLAREAKQRLNSGDKKGVFFETNIKPSK